MFCYFMSDDKKLKIGCFGGVIYFDPTFMEKVLFFQRERMRDLEVGFPQPL